MTRIDGPSGNRRGILSMLLCMALFIVNDALIKLISGDLPIGQMLFLRGLVAVALIAAMIGARGQWRQVPRALDARVLIRAGFETIAAFVYLLALFNMPIANATAINMSAPLILTVMAATLLREQVGWRRWSAVAVGFAGVLLIVQPTPSGIDRFALLALAGTLTYCLRDIATRGVAADIPSIVITLATAVMVTLAAGLLMLIQGWRPMNPSIALILAGAAVFLVGGYYFMIDAIRHGELSVVAPFRYSILVWSLLLGYFLWGDVPNALAFAGMAVVVASGLYILHRERVRARG